MTSPSFFGLLSNAQRFQAVFHWFLFRNVIGLNRENGEALKWGSKNISPPIIASISFVYISRWLKHLKAVAQKGFSKSLPWTTCSRIISRSYLLKICRLPGSIWFTSRLKIYFSRIDWQLPQILGEMQPDFIYNGVTICSLFLGEVLWADFIAVMLGLQWDAHTLLFDFPVDHGLEVLYSWQKL